MNLIKSEELITIFTLLNEGKLNYILMRNINNEIPSNVEIKKDIFISEADNMNITSDEVTKGKVTTQKDKLKSLRGKR